MSRDVVEVRTMRLVDVPLGMRLKDQAGWNQTEADWERLLALASDGGVRRRVQRRAGWHGCRLRVRCDRLDCHGVGRPSVSRARHRHATG